jgi:hypothetical protein
VPPAPPEHALLAAQRSAGNAAVSRMLARSPLAPPGPVGDVTASIAMIGYEETEEATAVRELTLGPAAGFRGFETEQEAVVAAAGSEKIGVVVADAEGRFHAYATDLEPVWGPIFSGVTKRELGGGARVVRFTHLDTSGGAATFAEQTDFAERLVRIGELELARKVYLGALETATGLDPSELHDATGGKAEPGKVSFDLGYKDANAHAGITGKLPSDRTTPLPEGTLTIGPGAFLGFAALRATVLHEFEHVNHARQAKAAVERWRAETTGGSFDTWLARERKAGRLSLVEEALIREEVGGGTKNTESMSYLVSFMAAYEQVDLSEIPVDDNIAEAFVFGKLEQLTGDWIHADHVVADHVVARMQTYRDALGEPHRSRLMRYATRRHTELKGTGFELFWNEVK